MTTRYRHTLVFTSTLNDQLDTVTGWLARGEVCGGSPGIASTVLNGVGKGAGNDTVGGGTLAEEERDAAVGSGLPCDSKGLSGSDDRVKTGLVDGVAGGRVAHWGSVCGGKRSKGGKAGGEEGESRHFDIYYLSFDWICVFW